MEQQRLEEVVQNVNARLAHVEQILPTLATKTDVSKAIGAAIAPLATKAELAAAVAPLATKAELAAAVAPLATKAELAAAVAPLATKADLVATTSALRAEIKEEGERTRGHFDAVAERLEGHIRLLAEGQVALHERMDERFENVEKQITGLDRRVMRLEATRR